MAHKGKQKLKESQEKQKEVDGQQVVKMKFKEPKFMHPRDLEPRFHPEEIYEIKGAGSIQFWLNQGGEIVEGELTYPEIEPNPSVIVPNEYTEQNPFSGEPSPDWEQVAKDLDPKEGEENEIPVDGEK